MSNLSIVIPCYNEPENIPLVIKTLKSITNDLSFALEVIIVDGASNDGTQDVLKQEFKTLDKNIFKLILQENRNGYGFDIIEGLKASSYEVLAWTHADMQTDINDVIKGFKLYKTHSEKDNNLNVFVKGQRKGRKPLDAILTFGMQVITFLILRVNIHDINAQPKIFSRTFFEECIKDKAPKDFSLDLFALIQARRIRSTIISFPVLFQPRILGEAKGGGGSLKNRISLISRTFKYILKLKNILN